MKRVLRVFVLVLAALAFTACGDREAADGGAPGSAPSADRVSDARITLSSLDSLSIELADGVAETPNGGRVTLLAAYSAEGDFDSDGTRETAVLVVAEPGGTGVYLNLLAFQIGPDRALVQVADRLIGDRQEIHRFETVADSLLIEITTQGPNDPVCCPTRRAEQAYRLVDGVWRLWRDITMSAAPPDISDGVQRRDSALAQPGPVRPGGSG